MNRLHKANLVLVLHHDWSWWIFSLVQRPPVPVLDSNEPTHCWGHYPLIECLEKNLLTLKDISLLSRWRPLWSFLYMVQCTLLCEVLQWVHNLNVRTLDIHSCWSFNGSPPRATWSCSADIRSRNQRWLIWELLQVTKVGVEVHRVERREHGCLRFPVMWSVRGSWWSRQQDGHQHRVPWRLDGVGSTGGMWRSISQLAS